MRIQIARISRFLLGLVFIFSGFVKAVDPWGSQFKLEDYFFAFGWDWAVPYALVLGITLSMVEFLIGICFVFGLRPKLSLLGAILLMLIFLPLTLYLAITNVVTDCGCFGDAIKMTNWQTFIKNVVFTIMLIPIYLERKRLKPVLHSRIQWVIIVIFGFFILGISVYSLRHLPLIDFLPYKAGLSLKPDSTVKDQYFVTYKNKKTGQIKEYPADNFPWNDSVWMSEHEFVSQRIVPGKKPPYMFSVFNDMDLDVSNQVISYPDYQFMIVSYDLRKVPKKAVEKIELFIHTSESKNIATCILTANEKSEADSLKHEYQWEAPTYFSDDVVLKMMVRSNPGIVLMYDGVILKKWAWRDAPDLNKLDIISLKDKYIKSKSP
ncbi:MAG: DoxX family protein [Bacteroidales bacterium]|nr:DoxX family protein [Bacteroidales bacterium]